MKKFSLVLSAIFLATALFTFFILFDGNPSKVFLSWQDWTRDSPSLPYSAYKTRRVEASNLTTLSANKIIFKDNHLFWQGKGARALPELTNDGLVVSLVVVKQGKGYSNSVEASVVGAQGTKFSLGQPVVKNGCIQSVPIIKTSKWNHYPLTFYRSETEPFSGISETTLPSGQIIKEEPYLLGMLHGKSLKYDASGIPVYSKDYLHGQRHGTHIYWFQDPQDPDSFKSLKSRSGDLLPSLWAKIRDDAAGKFGENNLGSGKANKWIVEKYRLAGGEFQVQLLEHWKYDRKHGLFEGFDYLGNKTFKDEFKEGLRIKHRIFDKTKG